MKERPLRLRKKGEMMGNDLQILRVRNQKKTKREGRGELKRGKRFILAPKIGRGGGGKTLLGK